MKSGLIYGHFNGNQLVHYIERITVGKKRIRYFKTPVQKAKYNIISSKCWRNCGCAIIYFGNVFIFENTGKNYRRLLDVFLEETYL